MTIDPKKVAKEAVGAIFDDYEDERIMSRDRWEAVVEKVVKSHVDRLKPGYGGYRVGAFVEVNLPADEFEYFLPEAIGKTLRPKDARWFTLVDTTYDVRLPAGTLKPLGDGVHVFRESDVGKTFRAFDPPLLPDED